MSNSDPRGKERYLERQAAGQCVHCTAPLATTALCDGCRRDQNVRSMAKYRQKNPIPKRRVTRCRRCGGLGHFAKCCPMERP